METVLNNYEQMILLLGMVMVAVGYLVENVTMWGVGLKSAPPEVPVSLEGMTGRVGWPEGEKVWPAPLRERCSLTERVRFP